MDIDEDAVKRLLPKKREPTPYEIEKAERKLRVKQMRQQQAQLETAQRRSRMAYRRSSGYYAARRDNPAARYIHNTTVQQMYRNHGRIIRYNY